MIEPSDAERAEWSEATREYVEMLEDLNDASMDIIATERGEVMKLRKEVDRLQAQVAAAYDAITQIEQAYYQEASNPSPDTVRRMAAKMNGIARDAQDAKDTAAIDAVLIRAWVKGAESLRKVAERTCRAIADDGLYGDTMTSEEAAVAIECADEIAAIEIQEGMDD